MNRSSCFITAAPPTPTFCLRRLSTWPNWFLVGGIRHKLNAYVLKCRNMNYAVLTWIARQCLFPYLNRRQRNGPMHIRMGQKTDRHRFLLWSRTSRFEFEQLLLKNKKIKQQLRTIRFDMRFAGTACHFLFVFWCASDNIHKVI